MIIIKSEEIFAPNFKICIYFPPKFVKLKLIFTIWAQTISRIVFFPKYATFSEKRYLSVEKSFFFFGPKTLLFSIMNSELFHIALSKLVSLNITPNKITSNLWSPLPPLLGYIEVCLRWVFRRKFNSAQFLFKAFFDTINNFCSVQP